MYIKYSRLEFTLSLIHKFVGPKSTFDECLKARSQISAIRLLYLDQCSEKEADLIDYYYNKVDELLNERIGK